MKGQHPATQFKKNWGEPNLDPLQDANKNENNKKLIGRRTRLAMDDKVANGNNFMFEEDIRARPSMMDLYDDDDSDDSDDELENEFEDLDDSDDESSDEEDDSMPKKSSPPRKQNKPDPKNVKSNNNINNVANNLMSNTSKKRHSISAAEERLLKVDQGSQMFSLNFKEIDENPQDDKYQEDSESDLEDMFASPTFNKDNKNVKMEKSSQNTQQLKEAVKSNFTSTKKPIVSAVNNFKSSQKFNENDEIKVEMDSVKKEDEFPLDDQFEISFNQDFQNNKFGKDSTPVKKTMLNTSISTIKKKDVSNIFADNELYEETGGLMKNKNRKSEVKSGIIKVQVSSEESNTHVNSNSVKNNVSEPVVKKASQKNDINAEKPQTQTKSQKSTQETRKNDNQQDPKRQSNGFKNKENVKPKAKEVVKNVIQEEENDYSDLDFQRVENEYLHEIKGSDKDKNKKKAANSKSQKEEPKIDIPTKKKRKYDEYMKEDGEVPKKEGNIKKKKKEHISKNKIFITENQFLKESYNLMLDSKVEFKPIENQGVRYFGENNRYPLRYRVGRLNHLAGEKINYNLVKNPFLGTMIPCITGVATASNRTKELFSEKQIKKPKKRLVKGLKRAERDKEEGRISEEDSDFEQKEEEDEKNLSDLPEDFDEEDTSGNEGIVRIPPQSQKGFSKNLQVYLNCKILSSKGSNVIVVGSKKMKNMKKGESFIISPNEEFNFYNLSMEDLRISLVVDSHKK